MAIENVINLLNTIRDNASANYQARIPEANRNNMEDIRFAMIDDDNVMIANEFMETLLNKIVRSQIHTKMFRNPLKGLKKGKKPVGDTIEEIYTNFIKGEVYEQTGADLLKRNLPDTKTVYHRTNYKQKYKVTVNRDELSRAFASYEALDRYIQNTISRLYDSAELDEFLCTKDLFKSAFEKKAIKIVEIPDPLLSEANAKEYIKTVKTISGLMCFPSADFNSYLDAQESDDKEIVTFSRKDEQLFVTDIATDTSVSIDVLANTFNMSVAEFNDTKKIIIDMFPKVEGYEIKSVLIDENFLQIWDDLMVAKRFENGEGLYDNYLLHVWETFAYSILVNAVAFAVKKEA